MHKYDVALAINASMYKWRRIAEAPHLVQNGEAGDCALCQMFLADDCNGCPLYAANNACGNNDMYHTAYEAAEMIYYDDEYTHDPHDNIYAFYDLLCSLLDQPIWD